MQAILNIIIQNLIFSYWIGSGQWCMEREKLSNVKATLNTLAVKEKNFNACIEFNSSSMASWPSITSWACYLTVVSSTMCFSIVSSSCFCSLKIICPWESFVVPIKHHKTCFRWTLWSKVSNMSRVQFPTKFYSIIPHKTENLK